ncbi:nuclear transport factor 2 family protein [Bradyrhizobium sp. TZ2]
MPSDGNVLIAAGGRGKLGTKRGDHVVAFALPTNDFRAKEDALASADSEIEALLDSRVQACRAKDIDRLMSLYSPNIVYFDVVPPLRFIGSDAVRDNFVRWFNEYNGPIGLETHDLNIAISGDVAFAHLLHLTKGTQTCPSSRASVGSGSVRPFAASGPATNG